MNEYIEYLNQQISNMKESKLYNDLKQKVENSRYKLVTESGVKKIGKLLEYYINISVLNNNEEIVEIYDDGFLCAYTVIIRIKGKKVAKFDWDDKDFVDSIHWIIKNL